MRAPKDAGATGCMDVMRLILLGRRRIDPQMRRTWRRITIWVRSPSGLAQPLGPGRADSGRGRNSGDRGEACDRRGQVLSFDRLGFVAVRGGAGRRVIYILIIPGRESATHEGSLCGWARPVIRLLSTVGVGSGIVARLVVAIVGLRVFAIIPRVARLRG